MRTCSVSSTRWGKYISSITDQTFNWSTRRKCSIVLHEELLNQGKCIIMYHWGTTAEPLPPLCLYQPSLSSQTRKNSSCDPSVSELMFISAADGASWTTVLHISSFFSGGSQDKRNFGIVVITIFASWLLSMALKRLSSASMTVLCRSSPPVEDQWIEQVAVTSPELHPYPRTLFHHPTHLVLPAQVFQIHDSLNKATPVVRNCFSYFVL